VVVRPIRQSYILVDRLNTVPIIKTHVCRTYGEANDGKVQRTASFEVQTNIVLHLVDMIITTGNSNPIRSCIYICSSEPYTTTNLYVHPSNDDYYDDDTTTPHHTTPHPQHDDFTTGRYVATIVVPFHRYPNQSLKMPPRRSFSIQHRSIRPLYPVRIRHVGYRIVYRNEWDKYRSIIWF
jgi:hypothetical protein